VLVLELALALALGAGTGAGAGAGAEAGGLAVALSLSVAGVVGGCGFRVGDRRERRKWFRRSRAFTGAAASASGSGGGRVGLVGRRRLRWRRLPRRGRGRSVVGAPRASRGQRLRWAVSVASRGGGSSNEIGRWVLSASGFDGDGVARWDCEGRRARSWAVDRSSCFVVRRRWTVGGNGAGVDGAATGSGASGFDGDGVAGFDARGRGRRTGRPALSFVVDGPTEAAALASMATRIEKGKSRKDGEGSEFGLGALFWK
jgi:hypothetical protein